MQFIIRTQLYKCTSKWLQNKVLSQFCENKFDKSNKENTQYVDYGEIKNNINKDYMKKMQELSMEIYKLTQVRKDIILKKCESQRSFEEDKGEFLEIDSQIKYIEKMKGDLIFKWNEKIEEVKKTEPITMGNYMFKKQQEQEEKQKKREERNKKLMEEHAMSKDKKPFLERLKQSKIKKEEQKKQQNTNDQSKQEQKEQIDLSQIPKGMTIKNLIANNKQQILLLGIQKYSEPHGLFLHDILQYLNPDLLATQLPCDLPLFIKTSQNFSKTWLSFITGDNSHQFLINPNPKFLKDLIFNQDKLTMFIKNNIQKSHDFFIDGIFILQNQKDHFFQLEYQPNIMLQPLLYSSLNPPLPVIINGFPELIYREYIAMHATREQLIDLYNQKKEEIGKGNLFFDPAFLLPDIFIKPKIQYELQVLKQSLKINNKIVAIIDNNFIEFYENQWKELTNDDKTLKELLKFKYPKGVQFYDFVEKLVYLEFILGPFIQPNFGFIKCFPYKGEKTEGYETFYGDVFLIWDYYHEKLMKGDTSKFVNPYKEQGKNSSHQHLQKMTEL